MTRDNIKEPMQEIRRALLEADVRARPARPFMPGVGLAASIQNRTPKGAPQNLEEECPSSVQAGKSRFGLMTPLAPIPQFRFPGCSMHSSALLPFPLPFLPVQVSLPVVRRFVKAVTEKAVGTEVIRGVRPDQQLVKVRLRRTLNHKGRRSTSADQHSTCPEALPAEGNAFVAVLEIPTLGSPAEACCGAPMWPGPGGERRAGVPDGGQRGRH